MQYSEENVEFFCHSDFTCNQFLPFENGNFDSYAVRKMPFDNFTISEFWFWQNIAIFQRWNVLKPKLRDRVANKIAGFVLVIGAAIFMGCSMGHMMKMHKQGIVN